MGLKRSFAVGLLAGFLLMGCAGFSYKYYALDADSYAGTLKGPTEKDDVSLEACRPTSSNKAPCVCALTPTFLAMKQELLQLRADLKDCQQK